MFAESALALNPGSERCLSELLKSISSQPELVLEYSSLVSGGGVCRYRFARAEIEIDKAEKISLEWLENSFNSDSYSYSDSAAADAGCWLSILYGETGLRYIERSVELMPEEEFYRSLYIEKLIDYSMLTQASDQFEILKEAGSDGLYFWQTASSVFDALGDSVGAIEASRRAYELRRVPSSAADLGWKLYFYGRGLVRDGLFAEAILPLRESSALWSHDSLWAVKSDSLLDLMNEFTSTSGGYGEPL